MEKRRRIWATAALLFTAIIWGGGFVFQKFATEELTSSFIVAARFSVAGIFTALVTMKKWHKIDRDYLLGGLISGASMALGSGIQTIAMTWGTSPGKSAFLTAAYCVMVPFFYWIAVKEVPKKNHVIAALICLGGIGLISLDGNLRMTAGDMATLVCAAVYAVNIISIAIFCKGRDPMLLTMLQICIAAILGWVSVFVTGGMPEKITIGAAGNVLYLALFSTALCLSLQTFGLKYINATVATILLSLESVFGVVFSIFLYGELITPRVAVGFAVVLGAVIFSQMPKKEKTVEKNLENMG